jgi:hypothetical protein
VEDSPHAFKEAAIERFGDAVVLRSVVCGEAPLGALLLKETSKLVAGVLTATVRAKDFNFCIVLSAGPRDESLVGLQGLVLCAKDVNVGEAGVIIGECDVVLLAANAVGGRWSPHVGVDLGAEMLGRGHNALTPDSFADEFCVLTRVANDGGSIIDQLNAVNGVVVDEGADRVGRNMAKAAVESVNVNLLNGRGAVGGVGVLNFEQAARVDRDDADNFSVWVCDLAGFVLAFEEDIVASVHNAANGDNGECHVRRMEGFTEDNGGGRISVGYVNLEVANTCSIEGVLVSSGNGAWGNGAVIFEVVSEGGHMFRSSRVVELDLNFGWAHDRRGVRSVGNGDVSGGDVFVDLFDGSPSAEVIGRCACAFVTVVISIVGVSIVSVAAVAVIVVAASVSAVLLAVVIAVVVVAVVIVVLLGQMLTFLAAPFGPAIGLVVAELVAVVALDVACIHLLTVGCESFICAVLLATASDNAAVVLISDESDDLAGGDRVACTVGSRVHTTNDVVINGGKGS